MQEACRHPKTRVRHAIPKASCMTGVERKGRGACRKLGTQTRMLSVLANCMRVGRGFPALPLPKIACSGVVRALAALRQHPALIIIKGGRGSSTTLLLLLATQALASHP